jgi:hypothetical protein
MASTYGLCSLTTERLQVWTLLPDIDDAVLKAELAQRLQQRHLSKKEVRRQCGRHTQGQRRQREATRGHER